MADSNQNYYPYTFIKGIGLEMNVGEQRNGELCPWCKGGSSKEKSLNLSRSKASVLYNCKRASCAKGGSFFIGVDDGYTPAQSTKKQKNSLMEKVHLKPLSDAQRLELTERWHITYEDTVAGNWSWCSNLDRLFMPIMGLHGYSIGGVARKLDGRSKVKTYTILTDPEYPCACYYSRRDIQNPSKDDTIWLVEDQVSALRASKYVSCVALLGTSIPEALIIALKKTSVKTIVLALDKDAFSKSLIYQKKYGALFGSFLVRKLEEDLKDMEPESLKDYILMNDEIPF